MLITPNLIIILISLAGLFLSICISRAKQTDQTFFCSLKSNCRTVVTSDFSKIFGLPLDVLGILYYGLLVVTYITLNIAPSFQTDLTTFGLLIIITAAFLFSIYLSLVQALAIKKWCTWCLTSGVFCLIIFITAILNTHLSLLDLLTVYRTYTMGALTIGLVLGVGAITIYDILYIKFLKDLQISQTEQETLHTISQTIWVSIIIIIVAGFSLYLSNVNVYNTSAIFLVKIFVLGIILVGEAMLNILIAPQLIDISSGKRTEHEPGELPKLRRLSFGFSSISLVSWYTLLILIVLPQTLKISLSALILYYIIALIIGVIIGQIIDYRLSHN